MAETIKILLRPIQNKWTRELFPSFYLNVTNNSIMIFNNDYEAGKVQYYSLWLIFSTFYLNKISLQTLRFCLAKNHRKETGFVYSDLREKNIEIVGRLRHLRETHVNVKLGIPFYVRG